MDKKEIAAVWQAFLEVQEGKHKKEGKKLDPVGKEDGDIDNDGDKDSSDEYLAKRRKAIGKAMKDDDKEQKEGKIPPQFMKGKDKKDDDSDEKSDDKEEKGKKPEKGVNPFAKKKDDVKEGEESPYPSLDKKKREKKGSNLEPAGGPAAKLKGESVEVQEGEHEGEKEECPKCKGKGCDHCDDKGYHMVKKETYGKKKMKESSLFTEAELAALEEKMSQTAGATKSEPFMSTSSAGEKKFYGDHKKSDKKFEDMEDTSEKDASDAGKAVKSQSPTRRGEKRQSEPMSKVKG